MEFYITIGTQIENRPHHPVMPDLTPDGYMTVVIPNYVDKPEAMARRIGAAALEGNWSNIYLDQPALEFFPLGEQVRIEVKFHD